MKFKGMKAIPAAALSAIVAANSFSMAALAEQPQTYQVTKVKIGFTSANGETPSGEIIVSNTKPYEGNTVNVTVIPNPGCKIERVTIYPKEIFGTVENITGNYETTFLMPPRTVTVNATFAFTDTPTPDPTPEHDIVLNVSHRTEGADGTVSINKTKASEGESITIIATPNSGCVIKQITMFYGDTNILNDGETATQRVIPFQMPDATVYVNVTWDFATTPEPTPTPTPTVKKGDANCDGRVNAADATAILKHNVGTEPLTEQGKKNADMDDNGKITAADATAILKSLVNQR